MPRASALKSIFSTLSRRRASAAAEGGGGKQAEQEQEQQKQHAKAAATASTQAVFLTAVAADASVGAGQVRKGVERLDGADAVDGEMIESGERKSEQAPRASFFAAAAAASLAFLPPSPP